MSVRRVIIVGPTPYSEITVLWSGGGACTATLYQNKLGDMQRTERAYSKASKSAIRFNADYSQPSHAEQTGVLLNLGLLRS